jgi:hypothetical protein
MSRLLRSGEFGRRVRRELGWAKYERNGYGNERCARDGGERRRDGHATHLRTRQKKKGRLASRPSMFPPVFPACF